MRTDGFVNSQLVFLLPVGSFNCYVYLKYLFPLFQWHACKLAKLSACIVPVYCMTTINMIYIFFYMRYKGSQTIDKLKTVLILSFEVYDFFLDNNFNCYQGY